MSFLRIQPWILAGIAASAIANLYYSQPILALLGQAFGVSTSSASVIIVATLLGSTAGQLFVVPLADMLERRALIQVLLLAQACALIVVAVSSYLPFAVAASVLVGIGGAAPMVLLPYAAGLGNSQRGRSTGLVMSGLLLGILASRSVSGFASEAFSWRLTYISGAVLSIIAAITLFLFPTSRATNRPENYYQLLGSVISLVRRDRLVQQRMIIGALGFASFNLLWTGITLLMSSPTYGFNSAMIGLFGLVGIIGSLVAKNAGMWFDRGRGKLVSRIGWFATAVAWLILLTTGEIGGLIGVIAITISIGLLDAGMQAQHITNQSTLLSRRPEISGRVTTAYMSGNILAGAIGSTLATLGYSNYGWSVVSALGLVVSVAAVVILSFQHPKHAADKGYLPESVSATQ